MRNERERRSASDEVMTRGEKKERKREREKVEEETKKRREGLCCKE